MTSERVDAARVSRALRVVSEQRCSAGDNVKPLSSLRCDGADLAHYLRLADHVRQLWCGVEARRQEAAPGCEAGETAQRLLVGILAPAGGGKSTLVELLKLLLSSPETTPAGERPLAVTAVGLDDFLSSQDERPQHGVRTRWDDHSTNEELAERALRQLRFGRGGDSAEEVLLPCFSKGKDDRLSRTRRVPLHGLDVVLFEGWRVGVEHANFFGMSRLLDSLVFVKVAGNFWQNLYSQKKECAENDKKALEGYDIYAKFGGFDAVFERHYKGVATRLIVPTEAAADVVLEKGEDHAVAALHLRGDGRWRRARARMVLEELPCVVVGAGQAGLCASYHLKQAGVVHAVLEKAESIGESWRAQRWDSFRLVTENSLCRLPGGGGGCESVGEEPRGFMPRDKVVLMLQRLAARHALPVRLGEGAQEVSRAWGGKWVVHTTTGRWLRTRHVIIATGGFHCPRPPPPCLRAACEHAAAAGRRFEVIHASQYRHPKGGGGTGEGAVLVVGAGQSGTQIAAELAEAGRKVFLCVGRTALRLPRRVLGRDSTWWLHKTGDFATRLSSLQPKEQERKRLGSNPSSMPGRDVRLRELALHRGVVLLGRAEGYDEASTELLLDAGGLQTAMAAIEAFPEKFRQKIAAFVRERRTEGTLDPDLAGLEDVPMEEEPAVPLPPCENQPLARVSLAREGIDTCILCTGFGLNFEPLLPRLDGLLESRTAAPYLDHERCGAAVGFPGLSFLGLHWMHRWQSAILLGCDRDAQEVVARIVADLAAPAPERCATAAEAVPADDNHDEEEWEKAAGAPAVDEGDREYGHAAVARQDTQLTAAEAAAREFDTFLDVLPDGGVAAAVLSVDGAEAPLTFDALRHFCVEGVDLAAFGIGQMQRLCTCLPNGPLSATSFLCLMRQCTLAPLNCLLTAPELKFEFEDLPATAVVVLKGAAVNKCVLEVASELDVPVLELVPGMRAGASGSAVAGLFHLRWHASTPRELAPLAADAPARRPAQRSDIALVLHTSGTTRKPKIVPLTHANVCVGAQCIASTLGLVRGDVCLNIMPLFHIHGQVINLLASLVSGAAVLATPGFGFGVDSILEWLAMEGAPERAPTWYSAVPTMHMAILEHARQLAPTIRHRLRLIRNCSAALVPTVGRELEAVFGVQVMPTYAMTESMPICSNPRSKEGRRLETVGFAGGPAVRVCRGDGSVCARGEHGEVCVRGENVTAGYEYREHMKGTDPNDEGFHDGSKVDGDGGSKWLRTGDQGFVDATGHLTLIGRYKEIINRGGEKVSPFEVEDALLDHPAVRNLIAFAVPHAALGEAVGVAVVLQAGRVCTLASLREHCRGRLSLKWLPEALLVVAAVPKGPTGKPDRIGLARAWKEAASLPALASAASAANDNTWDAGEITSAKMVGSAVRRVVSSAVPAVPVAPPAVVCTAEERAAASGMSMGGLAVLSLQGVRECAARLMLPLLAAEVTTAMGLEVGAVEQSAPLLDAGLDSLGFNRLRQSLSRQLGVTIPGHALTDGISTQHLAKLLAHRLSFAPMAPGCPALPPAAMWERAGRSEVADSGRGSEGELFELLPMQRAYWWGRQSEFDGARGAWLAWEIALDSFDAARFAGAVRTLVRRHDALRLLVMPGGCKQRVMPVADADAAVGMSLRVQRVPAGFTEAWCHAATAEARALCHRGFDDSPLWRIVAVPQGADEGGAHALFFAFDLLIADATSLNVLTTELELLYVGGEAALSDASGHTPPPASFEHHARAILHARQTDRLALEAEEAFWAPLADAPPRDDGHSEHDSSDGAAVRVQGLPLCPQLPHDAARGRRGGGPAGMLRHEAQLDAAAREALRRRACGHSLTEAACLFAAYCCTLGAWSSTSRFTVSVARSTRPANARGDAPPVVGQFMEMVLVECDLGAGCGSGSGSGSDGGGGGYRGRPVASFVELARALQRRLTDALDHSHVMSGVDVMQRLNKRDGTPGRAAAPFVFASALGLPCGADERGSAGAGAGGRPPLFHWAGRTVPTHTALSTPQVELDHQVMPEPDGSLHFNFDFEAGRFPAGLPGKFVHAYVGLLDALGASDAAWRRAPSLVPVEELAVRHALGEADAVWAAQLRRRQGLLHAPVLRVAAARPGAIAVEVLAGGAGVSEAAVTVTYGELARLASQHAHRLARCLGGGAHSEPVGVLLPKGWQQVVAVLAAHVAGRAYVPLSVHWPAERLRAIAAAVGMRACFTLTDGPPALPPNVVRVPVQRLSETEPTIVAAEAVMQTPDDTAYIIFTSGSTGHPKGVVITHRGASNTVQDVNERFGVGPSDAVLALAELTFDLSVYDVYGLLGAGGRVVMPQDRMRGDPAHYLDALEAHSVTVWNTAPAVMAMLLEHVLRAPGALARFRRLLLRLVLLSGDYIQLPTPPLLYGNLAPRGGLQVVSLGGATEASIWSNFFPIPRELDLAWTTIPYGRGLANQALHVLDACLRPVPDAVVGEICIVGDGLAVGYQGTADSAEAKTARAFVFSHALDARVYRTGDLGRFMPCGNVEFLGRKDFQLKISGHRVELAEVQRACSESELVQDAVVIPAGAKGRLHLVAFIRPVDTDAQATGASETAVRDAVLASCVKLLPAYMHPTTIHLLSGDKLGAVLSDNGKLDRKKLSAAHKRLAQEAQEGHARGGAENGGADARCHGRTEPRSDTEARLLKVWHDVLGLAGGEGEDGSDFGVLSSFAELGGDSINSASIVSRVNENFGTSLRVSDIVGWGEMTVASLAGAIQAQAGGGAYSDDAGAARRARSTPRVLIPGALRAGAPLPPGVMELGGRGAGPPLFLVAPVSGNGAVYALLARELGPQQTVYALSCPGLEEEDEEEGGEGERVGASAPLRSVPAIAARMLLSVQRVLASRHASPRGSGTTSTPGDKGEGGWERQMLHLGGWSFGGVVAFEMARNMPRNLGLESLTLIDSPAPYAPPAPTTADAAPAAATQRVAGGYGPHAQGAAVLASMALDYRLSKERTGPTGFAGASAGASAGACGDDAGGGASATLLALQNDGVLARELTVPAFARMVAVYGANAEALHAYHPSAAEVAARPPRSRLGELHLLRAVHTNAHLRTYGGSARLDFGWGEVGLPPSRVCLRLYEGDHYGPCRAVPRARIAVMMRAVLTPRSTPGGLGRDLDLGGMSTAVETSQRSSRFIPLPRTPGSPRAGQQGRPGFRMGTGSSAATGTDGAVHEAMVQLLRQLRSGDSGGGSRGLSVGESQPLPQLVIVACSPAAHDGDALLVALRRVLPPHCALHCCSSLGGGISADGHRPLTLLGLCDPRGAFGTGLFELPPTPVAEAGGAGAGVEEEHAARIEGAGAAAAQAAFYASGVDTVEPPALAIVTATRGCEESVLAGIRKIFPRMPVIGGSAADDGTLDPDGCWVAGASRGVSAVLRRGIVVSLLWPSVKTSMVFSSAYTPTAARGIVTRVSGSGRTLHEINGRAAAEVYAEWVGAAALREALAAAERPTPILGISTLYPLARVVQGPAEAPAGGPSASARGSFMSLVHPETICDGSALTLFAAVREGEELTCVTATVDELDAHTERVLAEAPAGARDFGHQHGALLVYCGGCALALGERLDGVASRLGAALQHQPFLGLLTYGEQGVDPFGANRHANLMYALLRFGGD